jgi:hypothetical protein
MKILGHEDSTEINVLVILTPNMKEMTKMMNLMQRIPAFKLFGLDILALHVTRFATLGGKSFDLFKHTQ